MAVPLDSLETLRPLLLSSPLGLLSDIDGALSPIAPRPEEARVPEGVRRHLLQLIEAGVRVAFVTGRRAEVARRWLDLPGAVYVGNHGLEVWDRGRLRFAPGVRPFVARARAALEELAPLGGLPGVLLEEKGPVLAVHYRLAPDPERARELVLGAVRLSPAARAFQVHEGKMVVELRPPLGIDKGRAARLLARRWRGVLALGDDTTDADMFRALQGLRGKRVACVAVLGEGTPTALLELADYSVPGVSGVEWLLGEMVRALRLWRRPAGPATDAPART